MSKIYNFSAGPAVLDSTFYRQYALGSQDHLKARE